MLQQPWFMVPALAFALVYLLWRNNHSNDDWSRVISPTLLRYFSGPSSNNRYRNPALLVAALACFALSGPSIPKSVNDSSRHSEAWFVVADVSRSMTLNDIAPNRLAAMRDTALAIASKVSANSIALIIYAGDAFLVTPPSFDTHSFTSHVALLDYGLIPVDGSNLTRALSLVLSITESNQLINSRVLILSDSGGMNNRSQAAVTRLQQSGHRTDILLFGSNNTSSSAPFDRESAAKLADAGGGKLVVANKLGQLDLSSLSLGKLTPESQLLTQTGLLTVRLQNLSHWILLLALPLLLLLFYRQQQ